MPCSMSLTLMIEAQVYRAEAPEPKFKALGRTLDRTFTQHLLKSAQS